MYSIRLATDEDKDQVMAIFNHYIENSMAAYPLKALPPQAWEPIKATCIAGNLWIAEAADGSIAGFAMLKTFMNAGSFAHTADVGYFIHPGHTHQGLGTKLLAQLVSVAKELNISVLVANVSSLNPESLAFHQRTGFTECGRIPGVGKKQGQITKTRTYHIAHFRHFLICLTNSTLSIKKYIHLSPLRFLQLVYIASLAIWACACILPN